MRQRRDQRSQRRAPSVATGGTDAGAGDVARGDDAGGPAAGPGPLGDLAGPRAARALATVAVDPHLGQSGRTYELGHRPLVVSAGNSAAIHATERLLAEHGGVAPTHRGGAGAGGAAPAQCRGADRLAGGRGGRLERRPHALRLGWEAARPPTAAWGLRRGVGSVPTNCGVTH